MVSGGGAVAAKNGSNRAATARDAATSDTGTTQAAAAPVDARAMMKRAQRKVGKKAWQKMSVGEKEQLVRSMSSGSTPGQQGAVGGLSGKKTGAPADYQPNFGAS